MQGQYEDQETGLYYNRYRYFDPNISAYISQDPIRLNAGTNLYFYGLNSVMWIDPMGLGCENIGNVEEPKQNPVFEVSKSEYPNHVELLENAQKNGHSLENLQRNGGTKDARKNRYLSQKEIRKQQGGPPKGFDYDEFPYASTKQGGTGAEIKIVSSAENQAVGRDLGSFYQKNKIKENDFFDIKIID